MQLSKAGAEVTNLNITSNQKNRIKAYLERGNYFFNADSQIAAMNNLNNSNINCNLITWCEEWIQNNNPTPKVNR